MNELLTVSEVAGVLRCSEDSVVKRFSKLGGVIDLRDGQPRRTRRYRVLRIPRAVLEKYLAAKAGRSVHFEVPDRPERRRKSDGWEALAVLNLAKIGKQNECDDRLIYRQIADRARLLAVKVPEEFWKEISWTEDEEEI